MENWSKLIGKTFEEGKSQQQTQLYAHGTGPKSNLGQIGGMEASVLALTTTLSLLTLSFDWLTRFLVSFVIHLGDNLS